MTQQKLLEKQAIERALHEARELIRLHGLHLLGWRAEVDNAKRRLGLCSHRKRVISLAHLHCLHSSPEAIRNTILHEIAHALVGPGKGHGPAWQAMASKIGARPERCSTIEDYDKHNAGAPWVAACGCQKFYRYKKPRAGKYFCKRCKADLTFVRQ
jgi:predicted SprT family Zn-dependent metalloprotease